MQTGCGLCGVCDVNGDFRFQFYDSILRMIGSVTNELAVQMNEAEHLAVEKMTPISQYLRTCEFIRRSFNSV